MFERAHTADYPSARRAGPALRTRREPISLKGVRSRHGDLPDRRHRHHGAVRDGRPAGAAEARRRICGSPGPGAAGAIYDMLNEDKRRAIEIIVEQKAEETDPETADGNLPELESPARPRT